MPLFNEQPDESEIVSSLNEQVTENESSEQLNTRVESAKNHFLEIANTEGLNSEIAKEAIGAYHDLLQILAAEQENRDLWFNTEVYKTYVEAAKVNPEYQEMVDFSQEALDMLQ